MLTIERNWKDNLLTLTDQLFKQSPCKLSDKKELLKTGGVYIFSTKNDSKAVYIGQTGDIRGRVFSNHLYSKRGSSFRNKLLGKSKNVCSPSCC